MISNEQRDRAFAQTGQFLSDEDILALLDVADQATNSVSVVGDLVYRGPMNIPLGPSFKFTEPDTLTPKYYGATCKCGAKIDPYIICDAYATNPSKGSAWHHAVKKLLRAGDGHKPLNQDIQEVIDTLKRWQEQINA